MRLIIEDTQENAGRWAAHYIVGQINKKQAAGGTFVLGLPTGSTPLTTYKELIALNKAGKVSFKDVVTFNMDEYVGLPEEHPESYHSFMWNTFFNHVDITPANVNILNGNAPDLQKECDQYEEKIRKAGGIDLFMGGVGEDGHPHGCHPCYGENRECNFDAERKNDVFNKNPVRHAGKPHERGDRRDLVVHHGDVGRFDSAVGASDAHRDADVGLRKRGRIVDAVARHGGEARALHFTNRVELLFGQKVRADFLEMERMSERIGGALVVAREHDDALEPEHPQVGDGLADPGLERILDAEHAHDRAVDRQIQRRQALHLELDLLLNVGLELCALILEYKVRRTNDGATPFDGRSDAVRHDVLDGSMAFTVLKLALACRIDHGACHRMREMLLQAGRKTQDLVLAPAVGREHASQTRLRLGERSGLIKHNGVGLGKRLKVLRALDHDAHLGGIAHGGHNGDGAR